MCWIENWVEGQSIHNHNVVQITGTWTQSLNADPLRYFIILPAGVSSQTNYAFGLLPTFILQITIPSGQQGLILHRRDMGDIITLPVNTRINVATATVDILTASYNPNRKMIYDRWCEQQLARLGAS